ncbi:MAG: hypothetical protein L0387_40795 [Acidobacteria bacterium]|nr:hypothetical protein [Acidobacteriota bacterium]MCI0720336.1 hypothetical protein [Acidobacteriota bacterium]
MVPLVDGRKNSTVYPQRFPLKLPRRIERAQFHNITQGLVGRGYPAESIQISTDKSS